MNSQRVNHHLPIFTAGVAAIASFLLITPASADEIVSVPSVKRPALTERAAVITADPIFQLPTSLQATLPTITVTPNENRLRSQRNAAQFSDPPQIGFPVAIDDLNWDGAIQQQFVPVKTDANGTLLGMRLTATNANGMRIGLLIDQLPNTIKIAFFAGDATTPIAPAITGAAINQLLAVNRAAGDHSDAGRTYWSPSIIGNSATILMYVPANVDWQNVRVTIPHISYLFRELRSSQERSAAYCNLDVSCYAEWSDAADGVAFVTYTENGSSYMCSGALLNDTDTATYKPYFLTANHCIPTQTVAATVETEWFYQSASCNDWRTDTRDVTQTGGATLLYNSTNTDTAFLLLNTAPPAGVTYLGWTTDVPVQDTAVVSIHHPDGDQKKISLGAIDSYEYCFDTTGGYFSCDTTTSANSNHFAVVWDAGITEGGSSGSPLFNSAGQVIGQLHGGSETCWEPYLPSDYGRFDVAYNAQLKKWLSGDTSTVTPPAIPTGVTATDGTATNQVTVNWNSVTGATSYQVYRCYSTATSSCGSGNTDSASPYNDTSATAGTTYYYRVKACNSAGCSDYSNDDSGYRASAIPAAPTRIIASDGTATNKVTISWNGVSGATSYRVYRCTTTATNTCGTGIVDTASPYDDTGATAGTTHYYRLKACNIVGCSDYSGYDSGYRKKTLTVSIPAIPTGVTATDTYTTGIRVSWNSISGATYYRIYRCYNSIWGWKCVNDTDTSSPYDDTGASAGINYYYYVKACNTAGCSNFSNYDAGYRKSK